MSNDPSRPLFNPFVPLRPTDPREAAIWDDVFGLGETDLGYFQRRAQELDASKIGDIPKEGITLCGTCFKRFPQECKCQGE